MILVTEMKLQSKLLLYLDSRRSLIYMKRCCEDFLNLLSLETNVKFPPLRFVLEIDYMDLFNVYPSLGNLLSEEPLKFRRICNDILLACLNSVGNIEDIQANQVFVVLRLRSIPRLIFDTNSRIYKGLALFEGLLLEISKPTPYVYHTVWSCPEECDGNEVILRYIPKVPPKCSTCRSVLFENSGLRRCGDQVTGTFKIGNYLLPRKLHVQDDMITQLRPGYVYNIIAVVLKKTTEVWSLEKVVPIPAPITMDVPADICELFKVCDNLPWKFIYCLASTIGVNICPLHCFIQLKINLLLSLTSVKAHMLTRCGIIHVLATGLDTSLVAGLMLEGTKLADFSLSLGTANTVVSSALVGSSGGICVMPLPLHTYNQKITSAIFSAIESGEFAHGSSITRLRSAVWAHSMDFKKINVYNVGSVFTSVCRGDHAEYEDEIAEFLLQRAIEPADTTKDEIQALKDVALYIDLVSGLEIRLDNDTESLLKNYFLAARKEGTRGVSVGSMESLVAICKNSARLCRRSVASIHDAIFAIWLHVSGSSEPRFAPDEYLQTPADVKKLQKIFNHFISWLEEFTGSFISSME